MDILLRKNVEDDLLNDYQLRINRNIFPVHLNITPDTDPYLDSKQKEAQV